MRPCPARARPAAKSRPPFRAAAVGRVLALALALTGGGRASRVLAEGPIPAGRPPEWGLEAGYGFSVHLNPGPSDTELLVVTPTLGVRLSSHLEYVASGTLEGYLEPSGSYFVGLLPVGARIAIGTGPVAPFANVGLGFGWTDLDRLLEISRRFNFRLEAGVGVRVPAAGDPGAWTVRVRFFHTSNGGTTYPNLGLNQVVVTGGWRFKTGS